MGGCGALGGGAGGALRARAAGGAGATDRLVAVIFFFVGGGGAGAGAGAKSAGSVGSDGSDGSVGSEKGKRRTLTEIIAAATAVLTRCVCASSFFCFSKLRMASTSSSPGDLRCMRMEREALRDEGGGRIAMGA